MRLMKRSIHRLISGILCISLLVGSTFILSACSQNAPINDTDILSQKVIPDNRQPITVLVKYAFSINAFEAAVEEKFPDIDIVQVGNYTRDMGIEEYKSRLEHDDLTDIVMTWPLDVGEKYWEDRLLDLSGFHFTSKYNLSMLNDISRDGKLYYLPGPSQVRGIIYNKTLFEENGWEMPTNFDEFVALCQTIEKSGMRSLQLGLGNEEVLDTAFVGFGYADCYSQPKDTQWIKNYNEGKGNFAQQFTPALNTFQKLIDTGILKPADLDITYSQREQMLFNRQCAMIEDSVLMARMGYSLTGSKDEYALMPFFNPGEGEDWARLYMVCYIGLNKHLAEPENKEKYDLVLKLMEYISTPEGQTALMGDTGAMFSSLVGMAPTEVPEVTALLPALNNGRYAIFPQLKNAQSALRTGLAGMVRGDLTAAEVCNMVDSRNSVPAQVQLPSIFGTATENFTLKETGNFVTDCMREESGCEIALFMDNGKDGKYNGKGISGSLYEGAVTSTDIARILPDVKLGESGTLWKVSMTGADLLTTLEHAISVDNSPGGWFYYFSGLRMEYDVVAQPGNRIRSITTLDGKEINPEKIYTIAVMDHSVPEEFLKSCEQTDQTIAALLQKVIETKKTISPSKDGRFITE